MEIKDAVLCFVFFFELYHSVRKGQAWRMVLKILRLFSVADRTFVSPHRVSNAPKERSSEGKTIFHHWCRLCRHSLCFTSGKSPHKNWQTTMIWYVLGTQFLLHSDPPAMATHLLLQHLGPKCCRQGKVICDTIQCRLHWLPSESHLLVQSRLG